MEEIIPVPQYFCVESLALFCIVLAGFIYQMRQTRRLLKSLENMTGKQGETNGKS